MKFYKFFLQSGMNVKCICHRWLCNMCVVFVDDGDDNVFFQSELDTQHKVRVAVGNGLRQDIFATFQKRFGIARVSEFYASTEGSLGLVNVFNIVGACGRTSPLLVSKQY